MWVTRLRIGENPVDVIKECASRLYDFHMKDVTAATAKGESVEVGKGVIDIPAVLRALLGIKFSYQVALEYEANGDNPMPGILGSYAYIRKVLKEI
jgi:Sugar phosphate isomerases/epimerases